MRRLRSRALLTLTAVAAAGAALACDDTGEKPLPLAPPDRDPVTVFGSDLNGANERPTPVTTVGTGSSTFRLRRDTIAYEVNVAGLDSVTLAHIHIGGPNVASSVMVDLFLGPTTGPAFYGRLAAGTITRATAIKVSGVSYDSLLTLMRTGASYTNVHTRRNPGGEIRGQVFLR